VTGLLDSEWLKIRTTRTVVWYLLGLVVIVGISVAGQVANAPDSVLESEVGFIDTLEASGWATLFALLFGIIGLTGEYRHETITQTFLATPVRDRVVAAKVVVYAAAGLLLGVFALLVTFAMALPWLAAKEVDPTLLDRDVGLFLLGLLATAALWGALGLAFASVVPNQAGAIVSALIWLLIIETIVSGLLPEIAPYTPGGAARGLMRSSDGDDLLPIWAAAAVSVGYVVALAVIGTRLVIRRDVT
jgi:ABC-2 type transport system permease protein